MQRRRRLPKKQAVNTFRSEIALEAPAAGTEEKNPRWIQIARTGLWKGYQGGKTIEFSAETFGSIVTNFRAHPSYQKGPHGVGSVDVIPWDFNHASEMDPSEGDLPVVGAPAQAWVQELEARPGADGKIGLWALTRLLEPVVTYIREQKIKWASVSVWRNAVDPVNGKEIGPLLTSVAFTNQPFIEGMQPIAASSYIGGQYFDRATDAEDALRQLRIAFGLSQTTSVSDVLGEIGKFQAWVRTGTVPYGVDADELVGCMRAILGLPALSTPDEVFIEVDKLLPALIEQDALDAREAPAGSPDMPAASGAASVVQVTTSNKGFSEMEVLQTLAKAFGIKATTEEAVIAAAQDAASSSAQLTTLFTAIGAKDANGAAKALADLFTAKKELDELRPKLALAEKRIDELDAKDAEAEIALVLAEHKLPDNMKKVLLDYRKRNVEEFRKEFPVTPPDKQHLTRQLFATTDGGQLGSGATGANPDGRAPTTSTGLPDVERYPGRNQVEQCMNYIRANTKGAENWSLEDLHAQACELNRKLPQRLVPRRLPAA